MSKVRELKSLPGVMSTVLEHEVTKTTHTWKWTGPKLNPVWPEVLAFFRWTYDTMQSESQVRLYLNVRTKEWKAWAFPQKAKTGMSAHELKHGEEGYERTVEQRAQFPDPDWYYWGTVHHHCSTGAFQSGPDENNEEGQDGIHITVGKMGAAEYDLHFRVYVGRRKLAGVPVTDFWDIGTAVEAIPSWVRRMMKEGINEHIAINQMCTPPPEDQSFPQEWRDNVIEIKPPPQPVSQAVSTVYSGMTQGSSFHIYQKMLTERCGRPAGWACDKDKATKMVLAYLETNSDPLRFPTEFGDIVTALAYLNNTLDDSELNIMDICGRCDVTPGQLLEHLTRDFKVEDVKEHVDKAGKKGNGKKPKDKGKVTKEEVLGVQTGGQADLEKDQARAIQEWNSGSFYGHGY